MFAHTTRIASVSTLSLALVAPSLAVSHAVPPNDQTGIVSTQNLSPSLEELEPSQTPAPVSGENKQILHVDGIDADALPQANKELTEPQSSDVPETSVPSEETQPEPQADDLELHDDSAQTPGPSGTPLESEATTQSETHGEESGRPENPELERKPEPTGSEPAALETTTPEITESSPSSSPQSDSQTKHKSEEEQQLAETAIQAAEGELAALTTPIESIDFIAAGLTWDSNTSESITQAAIRVREEGEWTQWHELEIHVNDEEMRANSPRAGTEPLITLDADAVQARVHTTSGAAPGELEITLIDPGESATDGQLEPASAENDDLEVGSEASPASSTDYNGEASRQHDSRTHEQIRHASAVMPLQTSRPSSANALKPAIVTRSQWGANESITSTSSQSRDLKAMFVHHTAGTNNYTRAQAYGQIRAIFSYHTESLRWGDIGYNFLVDRYGTIYEGRRGSMDSLPLGAQAGGFNTDTFGISTMGNFDEANPPAAMVESLKKVLAWKGHEHGINATGTTTLTSAGSTSKYSRGTRVNVNTILGHRDTHATACPGRYLYSQLPSIRQDVAKRIDSANAADSNYISINPGYTYRAQQNTILRSQPNSGSSILQRLSHGDRVTTTNLATNGWWRVTINGQTGWVPPQHIVYHTRYVPSNYISINPGYTYRAQQNTILRSQPNSGSSILQRLSHGDRVTTTNLATNGWWRVTINGQTGWVPPQHIVYHTRYRS